MSKEKKIKVPKSVLDLRMSPKKFAKKNNVRIKGKGLSKSERKHAKKRLDRMYAENAINGLNKAVKILAEHPDAKKIDKVKEGVDNIISNPDVMKRVAKLYSKNPESYTNMIFLPNMIMSTIAYYSSDSITDEEKEIAQSLDKEALAEFCEKILKSKIKRYKKMGLEDEVAFQLAAVVPTAKLFKNNRTWYKKLIQQMYDMATVSEIDVDLILKAIIKIDKDKQINKKDFLEGFFSEFILQRSTNKSLKFTENQKDLHETLIERTLIYLDNLKGRKLKDILKQYIKRRKRAEEYKNDTKRVIKFIDHANSNSSYTNIKSVVQELIADNSTNELYLS